MASTREPQAFEFGTLPGLLAFLGILVILSTAIGFSTGWSGQVSQALHHKATLIAAEVDSKAWVNIRGPQQHEKPLGLLKRGGSILFGSLLPTMRMTLSKSTRRWGA